MLMLVVEVALLAQIVVSTIVAVISGAYYWLGFTEIAAVVLVDDQHRVNLIYHVRLVADLRVLERRAVGKTAASYFDFLVLAGSALMGPVAVTVAFGPQGVLKSSEIQILASSSDRVRSGHAVIGLIVDSV
jgi:hypothetical protein